ncbi:MAG: GNAT family N-acetyltransferase [Roseovarius sp.]
MSELCRPSLRDVDDLTSLCLRSKAYWGYDAEFMAACVPVLTLTLPELQQIPTITEVEGGRITGMAQVSNREAGCYLQKLFVDPAHMGMGTGRRLFAWAAGTARDMGATEMIIDSDPGAVPFYTAMGCRAAGNVPSEVIPGRMLPRLVYDLQ